MVLYLSIISFFAINLYQVIARKFNKTVFIIGLSTAFWLITLPTYSFDTDFLTIISKFLLSLLKLTDLFSFGVDVQALIDNLPSSFNTSYLYFWIVFLYSCSSFFTLSFLLSLFSQFLSVLKIRYFNKSCNYIFSGTSDNHRKFAYQLKQTNENYKIIFTSVKLDDTLQDITALNFSRDVTYLSSKLKRANQNHYYLLDKDITSIEKALNLIESYGEQTTNDFIFVQDSANISENYLQRKQRTDEQLKIRLINSSRSTIYNYFFENYTYLRNIFHTKGKIVVVGNKDVAKEIVKLLLWLSQIVSHELELLIVTSSDEFENSLKYEMPAIFEPIEYETPYSIEFKKVSELSSSIVYLAIKDIQDLSSIFMDVNDFINIELANHLTQSHRSDLILAFTLSSPLLYDINISNFKNNLIDVSLLSVHYNSNLEKRALELHKKYQDKFIEQTFYNNQYNYFSSMSRALGDKYMIGHVYIDKDHKIPNTQNLINEHNRWSIYLKSEGWLYNKQKDKYKKHHHLLIPFDDLSEIEKRKDLN